MTGTLGALVEWSITEFEGYPEYSKVARAMVGLAGDNRTKWPIRTMFDIIASFDDAGTEDSAHGVLRPDGGDGTANELILDRWVDEFGDQFFPYRYATPRWAASTERLRRDREPV